MMHSRWQILLCDDDLRCQMHFSSGNLKRIVTGRVYEFALDFNAENFFGPHFGSASDRTEPNRFLCMHVLIDTRKWHSFVSWKQNRKIMCQMYCQSLKFIFNYVSLFSCGVWKLWTHLFSESLATNWKVPCEKQSFMVVKPPGLKMAIIYTDTRYMVADYGLWWLLYDYCYGGRTFEATGTSYDRHVRWSHIEKFTHWINFNASHCYLPNIRDRFGWGCGYGSRVCPRARHVNAWLKPNHMI